MYQIKVKCECGEYISNCANTLNPEDIGTHDLPDGWTIKGEIIEDYYEWVNEFTAKKGKWRVWGNFEEIVYATSKKAYKDFVKYHPPHTWDYDDI
jgi:hypothetical protein